MRTDRNVPTGIDLGRLVNALPALVWTTQSDGRSDFVNHSWCKYTGFSTHDALDHGWQGAIHADDLSSFLECCNVIQRSGAAQDIDVRLRRFDGEYRWFVFRPSPLEDVAGCGRWCWLGLYADEGTSTDGRLRRLFDMVPLQAGFLDTNCVLEFTNLQSLEDFGMTRLELEQWTRSGIIHVDDHDQTYKDVEALLTTGEMMDQQLRMLYPDGRYRWTRARCVPVRDAQGNVVRYMSFQIDVDDLKRAEDLLAAEVNVLEKVARSEPLSHVLEALRRHVEQLCEGCLCKMVMSSDSNRFELDAQPSLPPGYTSCLSMPILSGSGQACGVITLYRRDAASPRAQEHDLVDRFAKIAGIAIERARAEAALRASEAEQRRANMQLMDAHRLSRTGSFTWDLLRDEHTWTREIYRLFEFDPATRINGQMMLDSIHPEDRPVVESMPGRTVASAEFELEFRVMTRRGAVKHARLIARHIGQVEDQPVLMGAMQDVTTNKIAAEALNQARLELAHVARMATLSTMTASITHEVSQPISGILTNSNTSARMLAADPPNVAGAVEAVRRTMRDADRASEVIKRLRAMFAKKTPTMERVDLNEAAQEVIALSSAEMRRSRAALQTEFAQALPAVRGDRVQLQQVILNLLLNAADAMAGIEDRPRTLRVQTTAHDHKIKLLVQDSGVGVNPHDIQKLFEAFHTTKANGLGIGLAISRSIIESHRGKLWAIPNDGPGATFGFSLPCA